MEEKIVLFFHTLATITWVGGMIFLFFLSREVEKLGPQFQVVMGKMAKTFSKLAVLSIVILIMTGILLTSIRGGAARVQRDLILDLKYLTIFVVFINGALLATKILPNLEKFSSQKSPQALVWQKRLKIHSALNLVLGILIVLLAIL